MVKEYCEHDIDGVYFDAPGAFGYAGVCFAFLPYQLQKVSGMDLNRWRACPG